MSRSALTTLIVILAILVVGGAVYSFMRTAPGTVITPGSSVTPSPTASGTGEPVACTLDAKICPDGSAVGRIGPNCEFAACPVPTSSSSSSSTTTLKVSLNTKSVVQGVSITPVEVVEDSRCPVDVVCIQAGTVRVRSNIILVGGAPSSATFVLNTPQKVGPLTVTLTDVTPTKRSTSTVAPGDYRFTFIVR
jgi:hypothetical protein